MPGNNQDTRMADAANGFQQSKRSGQANDAAYTIYTHSDSDHTPLLNSRSTTSINHSHGSNHMRAQQLQRELAFSTVRRLFCLVATFDFLMITVLWFIYVNLTNSNVTASLTCEVLKYTVRTSLFDFPVVAAFRCVILLLAYALFRSKRWWTVALTTSLSCIFLITKVFLYDFEYKHHDDNPCVPLDSKAHPVDFLIAIVSFIIPWIETWILDFQVISREMKLQRDLSNLERQQNAPAERPSLLQPEPFPANTEPIRFYSPEGSQASETGSDSDYSESLRSHASEFQSLPNSRQGSSVNLAASIEEQEYLQKAKESLRLLDRILAKQDGWHDEVKKPELNAIIRSNKFDNIKGKIYKLETQLPSPPEQVVDVLWDKVENAPSWNPTVLESEVLQQIDDHTDILYNVSTGGPGNIVAGRDFVAVRNYWQRGDVHVCSSIAVEHPKKPPCSKYVRGFNGPTGWVIESLNGDPSQSRFLWILNTDLNFKVWTPQAIIDTALCHVLMDICTSLQKYLRELHHEIRAVRPECVNQRDAEKVSISSYEDLEEHSPSLDSFGSV
ncbi:stAR-related lipid transfer protein 3-like isoform X2 [Acanthaster planci]|uniref:StAR-related lipid transfer protein 3-like isoform X2 n=1 Tax=Acanthaster planci TaxID=133434 RepID=A0A8B7Y435_ACAPL|nr:stAR-related lipid transfer protein 3-like isoform X2 [Acanthaster planci]